MNAGKRYLIGIVALCCLVARGADDLLGEAAKTYRLLAREMEGQELKVTVDLHLGDFSSTIYTCDFSLDYVHINADYTT